jgi:excisionase family DNA binding protein
VRREPRRLELTIEDRWLSVDEIAAYLGIKRDTVYKWIGKKQMPAHRMGRLWKFRKDEVDEWVKSGGAGEVGSPSTSEKKTDD